MKIRFLFLLAAFLPYHFSHAQIVSVKESGLHRTNEGWSETVTNMSGSAIVALHATVTCIRANGLRFIDDNGSMDALYVFSRDGGKEIAPGGTFEVTVNDPADCRGGVDAAVFQDRHIEGNPESIALVFHRRRGAYKALSAAIPLLDTIASQQATPDEVIRKLQSRSDSFLTDKSLDVYERSAADYVFSVVKSSVQRQELLRTPSDFTPDRQPSINDLAKNRNITPQQAQALILMNKLQEWRAALEVHTEPPEAK
jgi:hypothetical protein